MKHIFFILSLFSFINLSAQSNSFDIVKFGAIADGKMVNTKAIQQTIDACAAKGGGTVVIPTGTFISGTLHLRSNINLFLESGAILKGSADLNDYEPYEKIHWGLFYTHDAENITISGEGNIDGSGDSFFVLNEAKHLPAEATQYTRQKDHFREVKSGIGDGPVVPKDRPYQMLIFSNCKRVTIKDVFITNSPFWCMHLADCDAVNISGIRLWTNLLAPNADGIDITSCTNVTLANCDIRTGDDAIAIVGYNHHFEIPGFEHLHHISENINVTNCNLQSASSGIRIGFLDQNTVRNIHISNTNITNSSRGIGIFLRDEGSLENITVSDVYIETKLRTGDWWGNGEPIHISAVRGKDSVKLGSIKHVMFNNIICKGENQILLYGTPESIIEDVSFQNIRFELADSKLNDVAGGNIDLRGVLGTRNGLFQSDIAGIMMQYVKDVRMKDVVLKWSNTRMPYFTHGLRLQHFENFIVKDCDLSPSPISKNAYRISAENGVRFLSDDKTNILLTNVK